MEDFDRLSGDFTLDQARESLTEAATAIARAHEKLKILEAAMTRLSTVDQQDDPIPETSYGYIAVDLNDFFTALYDLEAALKEDEDYHDADLPHRRVSFVEVGCGAGRNLYLLETTNRFELGRLHGFDISELQIAHGRKVFGFTDQISVADCMAFDYSEFDVVYFYRPMSNMAVEKSFEDHLIKQMKPGAYVIGCSNLSFMEDRRLISKCENDRIYKKLK